jgi:FAD/FMN-containing dehydrogenase
MIVRCASEDDVISAIQYAHDEELTVAVRGGGHSAVGFSTCDGGLVIDLSGMREVRVDPARKRATAQGGAVGRVFDDAMAYTGRSAPFNLSASSRGLIQPLTRSGSHGDAPRSPGSSRS